jgi:hypothetical protein
MISAFACVWSCVNPLATALEESAAAPSANARFTRGPFVQNTSTDSTQIIWRSSELGTSRLQFGETPDLASEAHSFLPATNHVMMLTDLKPDTR